MTRFVSVNKDLSINVKNAVSVGTRIKHNGRSVDYWIDIEYKDKSKSILVGSCYDEKIAERQEYERQLTSFMNRL